MKLRNHANQWHTQKQTQKHTPMLTATRIRKQILNLNRSRSYTSLATTIITLTFISLFSPQTFAAQLSDIQTTSLFQQRQSYPPFISVQKSKLFLASTVQRSFQMSDLKEPANFRKLAGDYWGNSNIVSHPSGWVALCTHIGQRITLVNTFKPGVVYELDFPMDQALHCFGLDIEVQSFENVSLWIGASGNRHLLKLNLSGISFSNRDGTYKLRWSPDRQMSFAPVSGPFSIRIVGDYVFTLNGLSDWSSAIPYIFNAKTRRNAVGHPLGNGTDPRLTRGYFNAIFDDSKAKNEVYYIRPREALIHAFSATDPDLNTRKEFVSPVTVPKSIIRFHNCLIVMGESQNPSQFVQWSVLLYGSNDSMPQEILTTPYLTDTPIQAPLYQEVDEQGNLYVSHLQGVDKVENLIPISQCLK